MATDTTAATPAPAFAAASEAPDEPVRSHRVARVALPLMLLLVAGAVRFTGLGYPERIYFDETYYAPQGQEMITRGVEEGFAVHPPVGKWLIGAGIAIYGYNEFGFRAAAAAAGTLVVLFTYFAGLRLFRRRGVAALAAFFVAIDGLALTMSRIAMLDIFLTMFVVLGVWFLLIDRDRLWSDLPAETDPRRQLPRRSHKWRWFAGIALGLAVSTKWSALLIIGAAGVFVLVSEMLFRRRVTGSVWTGWWRAAVSAIFTLLVVPLVIYVVSYAGWFTNYSETRLGLERCPDGVCTLSTVEIAKEWLGEQRQIAHFHANLDAEHPYRSQPTTWPYLGRPVAYYYEACDDKKLADGECVVEPGNVEEILGIGNPAIWWMALIAFPFAAYLAVRGPDWRATTAFGFYAIQYVPWLFVARPNFLFYLTPAVPFLCLTLAYVLWRATDKPFLRWMPAAAGVVAVLAFLFWFPLWTAAELPKEAWDLRIWMQSWI